MELVVRDLVCARGGVTVLAGVGLHLMPGQALVLRGPNGIGKTTLLRTIAGLQPAISGYLGLPPDSVAYGAHSDGLKAMLSVGENLAFWAAIYGGGPVDPALAAYGLTALADRPAKNLSAGQKRRLALARILVAARWLWVLDEPTVALDADAVAMFAAALKAHLNAGGAALIATHIDLGLDAETLDLSRFRAVGSAAAQGFDEAFT